MRPLLQNQSDSKTQTATRTLAVFFLFFFVACSSNDSQPSYSGVCGDGVKVNREACDDGNLIAGDGCSANCEVEPRFACEGSGPDSCYCLALYTGDKCDLCKDTTYTGEACDQCADTRFTGAACDQCSDTRFTGPDCTQCADRRFKGRNCDECVDPKYTGDFCNECADERFKGTNCDQCVDSRYKGPNCDECADSRLTGPNCDQCVNPNFAAPDCTSCLPQFAGTNCDICSNDHFALPACDTCLPRFTGQNCELCSNDHFAQPDCTTCLPRFTGASCDECLDERFGTPDCTSCADPRFSGSSCDQTQCQPGEAYGENCWPIVPSWVDACYDNTTEIMCPGTAGDANCGMTPYCGQDAQYSSRNSRQFVCVDAMGQDLSTCSSTVGEGETVRDTLTGLSWTRAAAPEMQYRSLRDGRTYCGRLEYGGHNDWRLPTIHELYTIVNQNVMAGVPRTYAGIFPQIESQIYWSSTISTRATTIGWYIDFRGGTMSSIGSSYSYGTQCVRADQSMVTPGSRFRSSRRNNEFVTIDNLTGLMWQNAQQSNSNWQDAMAFCEASNYAGFDDWRLPKIRSLMSLVDYTLRDPATPLRIFTGDRMWSSTSLYFPDTALCVDFRDGQVLTRGKMSNSQFVCVR